MGSIVSLLKFLPYNFLEGHLPDLYEDTDATQKNCIVYSVCLLWAFPNLYVYPSQTLPNIYPNLYSYLSLGFWSIQILCWICQVVLNQSSLFLVILERHMVFWFFLHLLSQWLPTNFWYSCFLSDFVYYRFFICFLFL